MKFVFFDTETTGIATIEKDGTPNQICQLAYLVEDNLQLVKVKNFFFKVDSITPGAAKVNGLSVELLDQLSSGKIFADFADEIGEDFKDSVIVAHNVSFDERFLKTEFWRLGKKFEYLGKNDTLSLFKDIVPGYKNRRYGPKLSVLAEYFNMNMDKIQMLTNHLFGATEGVSFHDGRYDTVVMYVACMLQRERLYGQVNGPWTTNYCN